MKKLFILGIGLLAIFAVSFVAPAFSAAVTPQVSLLDNFASLTGQGNSIRLCCGPGGGPI